MCRMIKDERIKGDEERSVFAQQDWSNKLER